MDEEVVVSKELLKAIGAETRIGILKSLLQRQKTQSELAQELKLSAPTVLEHMAQLEKTNLIEKVPEEREHKWKYYRLTRLGRTLVERKKVNVIILLSQVSALITAGLLLIYLLVPTLLSALGGPPGQTPAPPVTSGGISNALGSLEATSRAFLGIIIAVMLVITALLFAIGRLARKNPERP